MTSILSCFAAQLVEMSVNNVKKHHEGKLESGNVELRVGDGWAGAPEDGPFDAIHVGAAAAEVPDALIAQVPILHTFV